MINLKNLFFFLTFFLTIIDPNNVHATDRSIFPSSRMGGGTRGQCGSRLMIHIVPSENTYSLDQNKLLAIYLGKTKDAKPLTISFNDLKTNEQYEEILFDPFGESVLVFKITEISNNVLWNSQFNCAELESNNPISFISNNSNPVSTLITSINNKANYQYQKFINQAYYKCGSRISSNELTSLMSLENNIKNELSKSISIVCP